MINPLNFTNIKLKNAKILAIFSFILALIGGLPTATQAAGASLYLSPSSGSYIKGQIFSVSVKLNSGGTAISAADGSLSFNDKLEVVSVSKSGSIFNLWVPPNLTFSNSSRTIRFAGGTTKSFNGIGTIFTITFRAKSVGNGLVSFSSARVLNYSANPVDILEVTRGGSYTISVAPPPPPTPPAKAVPTKPEITSPTHPDSNKWYKDDNPKFVWKLPSGVNGTSFGLDRKKETEPDSISEGLLDSKIYKNIDDGIWYFHLKYRNKDGWGAPSYFKVQIDKTLPDPFEITVDNQGDPTNPQPFLLFETQDRPSGIDYYEIKIGEKEAIKVKEGPYKTPFLAPGKYTVIVKAVDRAGNYILAMTEMIIEPIPTPIITDYPKTLFSNEFLIIRGTAIPLVNVNVYIQSKEGERAKSSVQSDEKGNWFYAHSETLKGGVYEIWVDAEDARGAKSLPSEKILIPVGPPPFIRIGEIVIGYLTTIISILVLIGILIFLVWFIWKRIREKKKRIEKEITEAEEALYRAFGALKKEVGAQIEMLDLKQGLTPKERQIRDNLINALKISEEFIKKEIKDIEKEIEKKFFKKNSK